ncbi:inactive heparanase-2 isoform X2 [Alligator mississippiensis]|uniref:inactive heparanase-2 isoform X2 n=1 Tax=Alligator mississippiensis TaxID=8496 RepID=UPI002877EBE0|nr:inactive heparanase-2 isoform X2 [Alligator mississippiensis]
MPAAGPCERGGAGNRRLGTGRGKAGQGRALPPAAARHGPARPRAPHSPPAPPGMPCPRCCPPGLLALVGPGLALLAQLALASPPDRRAPPAAAAPGAKGRTLVLLDVNTKSAVRVTGDSFLSLQLDPSIIHDGWIDFLSSRRLVTLARGLAPAFLRFAGKRTDFLHFQNLKNPAKSRGGPGPDYYLKNYEDDWILLTGTFVSCCSPADIVRSDIALDKQKGCKIAQHPDIMLELQREKAAQMHLVLLKEQFSNTYSNLTLTARSLDKLYNFADCSGLHLIFALNALRRNPNNSWNSSNALSLLKYSAGKKYNISWELGNEPNNYRTLMGRSVNGSQLGKDYVQLRSLLQLIRTYSRASLYGPNIGRPRKNVIALLEGFMKVAGSTVDAVTWQHYYIDSRVAKVTDFLKTRLLDTLSDQIRKIQKVVNVYAPGKRIWLEGVGASSAGGMTNLSDSFAAGFLWLNTLGMLAHQGIDVVMRHSFFDHGHNHLVDQNFNPLPAGCRGNWTWTCQLPAPWPSWGASRLLLLPPGCTVRRRGGLQASQPPASAGQRCLPPGASRPGLRSLSAAPSPGLCQRGDDKGSFSRFLHLLRAAGCPPSLACPATMEPPVPCALPGPGGRPALQQGLGCMTPAPTFTACTWA